MAQKDKFPSPTDVVRYLNNEESTSIDVIHEFQQLFDPGKVSEICVTAADRQKYVNRLKSIVKKLKSSLPDDTAMKYFLYGSFARDVNILSRSLGHTMHVDSET